MRKFFRNGLETAIQEIYSDSTIKVNNNALVGEGSKLLSNNESLDYINQNGIATSDAINKGGEIVLLKYNYIKNKVEYFDYANLKDKIK